MPAGTETVLYAPLDLRFEPQALSAAGAFVYSTQVCL